MKIMRFLKEAQEKTGLLENNKIIELSCSPIEAINSKNIDESFQKDMNKLNDVQILPPVSPSKIVCVGLNYSDHAAEINMELPEEPIIFMKPSTSVVGHLDNIIYPASSSQVDYEGELGIVLSKEARNVKSEDAADYIGGYTAVNDITARDLQRKDGQWTRAKSFDTFCPMGPCIETELDPMNQNISLKLNGEFKQKSNTKNMIFNVYELVEFISNIMTLKPGDVIATGTPPGIGPMNIGDTVEAKIEEIGILKNFIKKS
ncbi:fumarylacetoacetate hydrolase family protein [Methanobacterium sp.]|uniref:fumarylacetoacetate hydrolase family protein n=1 Tax=Methanobacterium sp. TaxID=2164 RepID=UPI003C77208E